MAFSFSILKMKQQSLSLPVLLLLGHVSALHVTNTDTQEAIEVAT